jgi:glucose 1-dehydrogenase
LVNELFKNQTAIISGGLGDIGRATALEFASHGAAVAIGDLHPVEEAGTFLGELRQKGVKACYHRVDVSDVAQVRQWVADVEAGLGNITFVIPNAATATFARFYEITPEQWSRELRINLDGAFYFAQAATVRMLHHKQPGRVVFVGSWAGHTPHPTIPAYSVAKAGLRMLCQCMALELAPQGILVNEVAPGYVDAGVSRRSWETEPIMRKRALKKVPIQELITAEEVAQQIVHLCHPSNRHMTGATLVMDGGLSLLS